MSKTTRIMQLYMRYIGFTLMDPYRCAKVTREKFHRGELQIVQVAVSNEKTLTITYPPTEREVLQMSLRNIGAGPAIANREDGADY